MAHPLIMRICLRRVHSRNRSLRDKPVFLLLSSVSRRILSNSSFLSQTLLWVGELCDNIKKSLREWKRVHLRQELLAKTSLKEEIDQPKAIAKRTVKPSHRLRDFNWHHSNFLQMSEVVSAHLLVKVQHRKTNLKLSRQSLCQHIAFLRQQKLPQIRTKLDSRLNLKNSIYRHESVLRVVRESLSPLKRQQKKSSCVKSRPTLLKRVRCPTSATLTTV